MLGRGARRTEDAHLVEVAVLRENLQRVAQLAEALVDQLDVSAVGLVAQKLESGCDNLRDQVAVLNVHQLVEELVDARGEDGDLLLLQHH